MKKLILRGVGGAVSEPKLPLLEGVWILSAPPPLWKFLTASLRNKIFNINFQAEHYSI
jgi:hypothetical protein